MGGGGGDPCVCSPRLWAEGDELGHGGGGGGVIPVCAAPGCGQKEMS